jgi:peptidoglycan/xylan/chitin deacetylase (PgdA/CDA1 family)
MYMLKTFLPFILFWCMILLNACVPPKGIGAASQPAASIQATDSAARPWKNRQCAVVLTYDDALNVHLSNAVPALDSFGLKGTFYLSDYFGGLKTQINGWRAAASNGHELGNHTVYHPCAGGPGREWVKPAYDLNRYTVQRISDEIRTMNTLLAAIDGRSERTFAFPCNDTKLNDTAYINGLKNEFIAARAVRAELPSAFQTDLYDVGCYMVNGQSGAEMIQWVKDAMAKRSMIVFLFHGVGGEHNLNVSLPAHRQLLEFLKSGQKDIWIAPMIEVAQYIKSRQSKK